MNHVLAPPGESRYSFTSHCTFAFVCWLVLSSTFCWMLAIANAFGLLPQECFEAILRGVAFPAINCVLLGVALFARQRIWPILRKQNTVSKAIVWAFVSLVSSLSCLVFC